MAPGRKPFEEDVGALQQPPQHLLAGVGLEVDGDAALAEIADDRIGRVAAVARAERARPVALADALDLDHLGAVLRQQHGAVGAGDALAEIDDLQAGEGRVVAHGGLIQLDQHLAEILAAQQADEGARRLVDALDDVLAVLELAAPDPLAHLAARRAVALGEVGDDEALRPHPLADEGAEQARADRRRGGVVLRDRAAQRDAAEEVDVAQHGVGDLAADIVEIDVEAVGAGGAQRRVEILLGLVVDAGIEAQLVLHEGAFLQPRRRCRRRGSP